MAKRTRKGKDSHWAEKIRTGVILDRLQRHVEGKVELTSSQVAAAKTLLNKVIPDVQKKEVTGQVDHLITRIEIVPKLEDKTIEGEAEEIE